jgi:HEAT repeat protein
MTYKISKLLFALLIAAGIVSALSCSRDPSKDIPAQIEALIAVHSGYAFDDPMDWQTELLERMQEVYGNEQLTRAVESVMINFLLSDATYAAKKMICMDFANIATDQSVPSLINMLEDEKTAQLAMLIFMKAKLNDGEALTDSLSKVADSTKISIINHFGDNREEDALALLYDFTQDTNQQISQSAFAALGKMGTSEAAVALRKAFDQLEKPVGIEIHDTILNCAEQLGLRGHDEQAMKLYESQLDSNFPVTTQAAALYGLFKLSKDPIGFIRSKLGSTDPELQPDIIRMVRDLPSSFKDGDELLHIEGLNSENRIQMLLILASRKDPSIHSYVLGTLENKDQVVREAALRALLSIATADDVDRLLDFSVGANRKEKDLALSVLATITEDEVDNKLIREMQNASPEDLLVLLQVTRERGITPATNSLLELCQHADQKVQVEVIRTLGVIAEYTTISKALDFLLRSQNSAERKAWERAVYDLASKNPNHSKRSVEIINSLKHTEDVTNVSSLIFILGEIKNTTDHSFIKTYLENSNVDIQLLATKALSAWPNSDPLNDLIAKFKTTTNMRVHSLALKGALQLLDADRGISNGDKLKLLGELMQETNNSSEKIMVISGYGEIGTMDSLLILVSFMKNSENIPEVEASIKRIIRNVYINDPQKARIEILKARELSANKEFQIWIDDGLRRERFNY